MTGEADRTRVFISWSGETSKAVAQELRKFLRRSLRGVAPWVSSEDIAKGERWSNVLQEELASSRMAVICVTAENLTSPWLNFEAGAVARPMKNPIYSFLFGTKEHDLPGPLKQFQATGEAREDVQKLLLAINRKLPSPTPEREVLEDFEDLWPDFQERLEKIHAEERGRPLPEGVPDLRGSWKLEMSTSTGVVVEGEATIHHLYARHFQLLGWVDDIVEGRTGRIDFKSIMGGMSGEDLYFIYQNTNEEMGVLKGIVIGTTPDRIVMKYRDLGGMDANEDPEGKIVFTRGG